MLHDLLVVVGDVLKDTNLLLAIYFTIEDKRKPPTGHMKSPRKRQKN